MKLWDSLTACVFLLSSVHASPPTQPQPSIRDPPERPLETPAVRTLSMDGLGRMADSEQHAVGLLLLKEVRLVEERRPRPVDSVRKLTLDLKRSSASPPPPPPPPPPSPSSSPSAAGVRLRSRARHRRGRKKAVSVRSAGGEKGGGGGGGGAPEARRRKGSRGRAGQGCMLKQIHLNVSDLGLGYRSEEEMIFRYCSGPCRKSQTNYDKILHNIAGRRRLGARDTPRDACCRPIAFDDDLSFLDDDLVYHTLRKHSARKCGCV